MRYSIRKQFAGIFIGLMAGTMLLCWFINSTFLERFYFANRQEVVMEAYGQLNEAAQSGSISTDDFNVHLQQLSATYNISILILDEDSETIRVSGGDPSMLRADLWSHIIFDAYDEAEAESSSDGQQSSPSQNGRVLRTTRVLARNESPFYLMQVVTSIRVNVDYLDMWGFLENGNLFFIRTALESMRDSTDISSRFLAYVGILATIVCGVVIWLVSKKITDPILELAHISERMAHLDFDARYQGKSFNEIAVLGNHMNELADALESTISELKTANNELQKDIEKKNQIDEMRKEFLAYCDVIMDESAKMNNMVKKLLTLNQLEFGNDVVTMERFDIVALIRNYIQSADILVKQNEATVNFDETDPVYVWGDEFKTEEVVMNYFSNALNHLDGDRVVDIRLKKQDKTVRISVFNTGIPIPEDSLPHLWEKFYKVDKARTREYGGSGVGLSIVKAIQDSIHQKYGVINYENGVEFWFEMELVEEGTGNQAS